MGSIASPTWGKGVQVLGGPNGEVTRASSFPAFINSHFRCQLCQQILCLLGLGPGVWWLMYLLRGRNLSGEGREEAIGPEQSRSGVDAEEFPKLWERGTNPNPTFE